MGALFYAGMAVGLIILILFIFACCKVSSRADKMDEIMYEQWLEEHRNAKNDK